MRERIAGWEGAAMTQSTVDPLSGKMVGKNKSFDEVSKYFINAMPAGVREQVLANPELADWLYSYAYNVGPGNFKKRVVPALERYYSGNGSVEDIQKSMWASGDSKLRGLAKRRAMERTGVKDALWDTSPVQWQDVRLDDTMTNIGYTPMNEELVANAGLQDYTSGIPVVVDDPVVEEPVQQTAVPTRQPTPYDYVQGLTALMNDGERR